MRYKKISVNLFEKNRQKLRNKLGKSVLAIVNSNDFMPRSGDLFFPYRQNPDLFYLTGIEQEDSVYVVFTGDGISFEEFLFIIRPNKNVETWEGRKLTIDEAKEISGIKNILFLDEYENTIKSLSVAANRIFLNRNGNDRFSSPIENRNDRLTNIFKQEHPSFEYGDLSNIMADLRIIKEPEEIDLMRRACEITRQSFVDVLHNAQEGMYEYEIESILIGDFIKNGASGHAFAPIIASGENSCYLHYCKNDRMMRNGEILFLDFGSEYANYASDCSRAIPVGGRFTPRQRQVYDAVLRIFKETKQRIVAGNTINKYHKEICGLMQEELLGLGLLSKEDIAKSNEKNPAYRKYFMHGVSHFIGLDTHDLGSKDRILQNGMVVSCEPGIYIPEEGFGIRLENDILINGSTPIDLTENIPLEAEEIEEIMNR